METFQLKDASGTEQVYSAENGVKIKDKNGEWQSYINQNRLVQYKAGLAAFGDAENDGAVICSPNYDRMQIFGKYEAQMSWMDESYQSILGKIGVSSAGVSEQLNALIEENWESIKARLDEVGSNADGKALFMGRVCDAPKIENGTEKSLAGLLGVLKKSTAGMTTNIMETDFLDASSCVRMYEGNGYYFQPGATASFPFKWQEAKDNGEKTEYKLNMETIVSDDVLPTMPEYETKRAVYPVTLMIGSEEVGCSMGSFCAGAENGLGANLVVLFSAEAIAFISGSAQSVPRSVILETAKKAKILDGLDDDTIVAAMALPESMNIPAGFSVAASSGGVWVIATEDSEDETLQKVFQNIAYMLVSVTLPGLPGNMDEFTKKYFSGGTKKLYTAGKKSFALEFNLVYPQTAEENTTSE